MSAYAKPAAEERLLGRQLGGYTITRCIGKGGMGMVYEAVHQRLPQRAAVKVLNSELFQDEKVLLRFFNEAKALSIVQHPSIVKVFEFGQLEDGTAFIMMELLDGESLLQDIARAQRQGRPLPLPLVLERGRQIAAALATCHDKGVVHRDLKPENVFLLADPVAPLGERIKLLDFGIAKFLDGPTRKTTVGTILGTPLYMSPEQCEGRQDLDEKVDVYALGVMLYEMVAGHLPFDADTNAAIMRQHIFKDAPALSDQVSGVPPALEAIVQRMLAKQACERPTMPEIYAAMDKLLAHAGVVASGPGKELALLRVTPRSQVVIGQAHADADPQAPTLDSGQPGLGVKRTSEQRRREGGEQAATPRPMSSARSQISDLSRLPLALLGLLVLALLLALARSQLGTPAATQTVAGTQGRTPAPAAARLPAATQPPAQALRSIAEPERVALPDGAQPAEVASETPAPPSRPPALAGRANPPRPPRPRPAGKRSAGAELSPPAAPSADDGEEPWR